MLVPVNTRNTDASDRPMTAQNAQNRACAAEADIVWTRNEKNSTKPSGASITTHLSGVVKIGT